MKRVFIIVCLLLLALGAGLGWLLASESGLNWAYRHASVRLPGLLTINRLQGRLAGTMLLTGFDYRQPPLRIAAQRVELRWNPGALLEGLVDVDSLDVVALTVELPPTTTAEAPTAEPAAAIELPALAPPLPLRLGRLDINGLRILRGSESQTIDSFGLGLNWRRAGLEISRAQLVAPAYSANVSGSLTPDGAWPHRLDMEWRLRLETGAEVRGNGRLEGDLESTTLAQTVTGPLRLDARLEVTRPLRQPGWRLQARLDDIDSRRFDAALTPITGAITLNANGDLESLSASGDLRLDTAATGPLQAAFGVDRLAAEAGWAGLVFEQLSVDTDFGRLAAGGRLGWSNQLDGRVTLQARAIDPARFAADWPGKLDLDLDLSSQLGDGIQTLAVNLRRLDGQLRGYPVNLAGSAQLSDAGIDIAEMKLVSARSTVRINGRIADQLALEWALDSPNLGEFWPGAAGSLSASGRLDGKRESPRLVAAIKGGGLGLAGTTLDSLEGKLEIDLLDSDPYIATDGHFALAASASGLQLGETRVERLQLEGDLQQIRASADTSMGNIAVTLAGTPRADGWNGRLLQADLALPDFGDWRLRAPAPLTISPQRIALDGACLTQQRGPTLCASVDGGGEDWRIDANVAALQLAWLGRWVPAHFNATGELAGSARLHYQAADRLLGDARLSLSSGRVDLPLDHDRVQRVEFSGGEVILQLAEKGIQASARLGLRENESCVGDVELPGAALLALQPKRQPLQAELRCRLADLDLAEAWVAEVDNLHGSAEIDLKVRGSAAQPQVVGQARVADVTFVVPRLGLRVDKLDAEAVSSGLEGLDFRADASLAGGHIELQGQTRLDGDAGWPTRLELRGRDLGLAPLLAGRLPDQMRVEGAIVIDGRFDLRLPDRLDGSLRLASEGGAFTYPLVEDEETRWQVDEASFEARSGDDGISASAMVKIDQNRLDGRLSLPGARPGALSPAQQAIVGNIELKIPDLAPLGAWLADIQQPAGSLQARLDVDGTVAAPRLRLGAELADASVKVPRLGLTLAPISATAVTSDDGELRIDAEIGSEQGKLLVNGRGRLDGAAPWPVIIQVSGQNFPAARLDVARIDVSPDLTIEIGDHRVDVSGEVRVPYARLRPRDITTADRVSADSVVVGEAPAARSWQITSKTRLILGDRVDFFGYGFDGNLGGNLVIEEQPGQPTRGTGEIVIVTGRYLAYGQALEVENGRLLFTGGPLQNPGLDFVAVRKAGEVTAGLRVGGRLQQPELELFSTPAMGQTDALSYLLTGGPLETATSQEGAMMANAALAIGLSGGDRIARSLGDRFGFDDLRVESSPTGEQASLVVGRYLSPRLYVSYGVGLIESINTLNLRYKISPSWRIEAQSGAEQGADLLYSIER